MRALRKVLRPGLLVPAVLIVALVVAFASFASPEKVLRLLAGFRREYLLYFAAAMLVYEAARCVQWIYLLRALDIHVPLRTSVFAFVMGEIAKVLPLGNYFQNYVLARRSASDFTRSSAASTLIIVNEIVVCLALLLFFGLGPWSGWLRPAVVALVLVAALVAWGFSALHLGALLPARLREHPVARRARSEWDTFRSGAADLLHPRVLLVSWTLGAFYVLAGSVGMYLIARGFGAQSITLMDGIGVYCFSLVVNLLIVVPIDIGLVEASGIGALIAVGASGSAALSIMLANRILSVAASIAIAALVSALLHGELRAAMSSRGQPKRTEPESRDAPDEEFPKEYASARRGS